jgi:hypothetical protein
VAHRHIGDGPEDRPERSSTHLGMQTWGGWTDPLRHSLPKRTPLRSGVGTLSGSTVEPPKSGHLGSTQSSSPSAFNGQGGCWILQSGGGEMLASLPHFPALLVATEGYGPNLVHAANRLRQRGAFIVGTDDKHKVLPFSDATFDLVTSRHPVSTWWTEIERVLLPGGSYLSQHVGPDSVRDLSEFIMGPWPEGPGRDPRLAEQEATAAGLMITDLREERLRTVFYDIGAVV